jgi:hypothetical protein
MSFLEKIGKAIGIVAPIALAFVPGGQIPAAVVKGLQVLPSLMAMAQGLLGAGTGEQKLDFVTQGLTLVAQTTGELSTGPQKELWENQIIPDLQKVATAAKQVYKLWNEEPVPENQYVGAMQ